MRKSHKETPFSNCRTYKKSEMKRFPNQDSLFLRNRPTQKGTFIDMDILYKDKEHKKQFGQNHTQCRKKIFEEINHAYYTAASPSK